MSRAVKAEISLAVIKGRLARRGHSVNREVRGRRILPLSRPRQRREGRPKLSFPGSRSKRAQDVAGCIYSVRDRIRNTEAQMGCRMAGRGNRVSRTPDHRTITTQGLFIKGPPTAGEKLAAAQLPTEVIRGSP